MPAPNPEAVVVIGVVVTDGVSELEMSLAEHIFDVARARDASLEVVRLSLDGRAVTSCCGFEVAVGGALTAEAGPTIDQLVLPGVTVETLDELDALLGRSRALVEWLRLSGRRFRFIGASSTATVLLAETGLADRSEVAAPAWSAPLFAERHPSVALLDREFVVSGALATARRPFGAITVALHAVACATRRELALEVESTLGPQSDMTGATTLHDTDIERATRWIRAHISNSFTMKELGTAIGMSERTLTRRFEAALATTPLRFTQRLRVQRAIELLETTRLPVAAVAARVGHRSPTAFRRFFVREVGCLPSQFRRTHAP